MSTYHSFDKNTSRTEANGHALCCICVVFSPHNPSSSPAVAQHLFRQNTSWEENWSLQAHVSSPRQRGNMLFFYQAWRASWEKDNLGVQIEKGSVYFPTKRTKSMAVPYLGSHIHGPVQSGWWKMENSTCKSKCLDLRRAFFYWLENHSIRLISGNDPKMATQTANFRVFFFFFISKHNPLTHIHDPLSWGSM